MPFFIVTYAHPDEAGWKRHLAAHVEWLREAVASGLLRASGPAPGAPVKSAVLILKAPSKAAALAAIETDPYYVEGLVADMTITEWDPIFGAFQHESSMPDGVGRRPR